MEIRKAEIKDLEEIMKIYSYARKFMAEHGNKEQWGDGYPQEELVRQDIEKEELFVCMQGEKIACVFTFFIGEDDTYKKIYESACNKECAWKKDGPYAVVHRVASAEGTKGAPTFSINWCYEQFKNLRMDTHEKNIPMQNFLKKAGFEYCGIIYTRNGTARMAYQKYEK